MDLFILAWLFLDMKTHGFAMTIFQSTFDRRPKFHPLWGIVQQCSTSTQTLMVEHRLACTVAGGRSLVQLGASS